MQPTWTCDYRLTPGASLQKGNMEVVGGMPRLFSLKKVFRIVRGGWKR
nr:MAG TPA: hypothetical protein [Caudoviricetes sp.]